eukprot:TRINITY_DN4643_c0_g1_i1.p1 TRINITY_DN4643_c0_g1~~TRINITY_DN4643_c0_g1_i1.p1  ORF type:complete len:252 (+),score=22.52 TRINITY_DN4643_c0_g1_i1:61-816(+)
MFRACVRGSLRGCRPTFQRQVRFSQKTVLRGEYNPWKVLGVSRGVSDADLKKAYIKLAKIHHPDKNGGDSKQFKKVKEAYDQIKSGEAAANSIPRPPAKPTGSASNWGNTYGGFAGQQQSGRPDGFENMTYSSSQTRYDSRGVEETTYTFRDANGNTFSYSERSEGGDQNFWGAFRQNQQDALRQEAERMRARADQNENFRRVMENWANHKSQESVDYQEYVMARDAAFYRFIVCWFVVFFALRILINIIA